MPSLCLPTMYLRVYMPPTPPYHVPQSVTYPACLPGTMGVTYPACLPGTMGERETSAQTPLGPWEKGETSAQTPLGPWENVRNVFRYYFRLWEKRRDHAAKRASLLPVLSRFEQKVLIILSRFMPVLGLFAIGERPFCASSPVSLLG